MKAFHNDESIKQKYLDRVKAHALADEIIKGKYWENGKGCAIGCTIHSSNHFEYEEELGIPEWIALVEDVIFEGMSNGRAKAWPVQFLESIPVGVDLDKVQLPFLAFILRSTLRNFDHKEFPDVFESIQTVIDLCDRNEPANSAAWNAANSAARRAARRVAESTAWNAARSAANSAVRSAAWSAARSAARSAANSAAEIATYEKFADKILELIRGCEVDEET